MNKGIRTSFVVFTYLVAAMILIMVVWQGIMVAGSMLAAFLAMPSFGTAVGLVLNLIALFSGVTLKMSFWLASQISRALDSFLQMMFPQPQAAA